MINKYTRKILNILKSSFGEKAMIEYHLNMRDNKNKVKSIGHNEDINSKYKNDFFDAIYEDVNGIILDVRFFEKKPSNDEIEKMSEYWIELEETYKRHVKPYFIIIDEKEK